MVDERRGTSSPVQKAERDLRGCSAGEAPGALASTIHASWRARSAAKSSCITSATPGAPTCQAANASSWDANSAAVSGRSSRLRARPRRRTSHSAGGKPSTRRVGSGTSRRVHALQRLHLVHVLEEAPVAGDLPERRREREDVGPAIDGGAHRLLRRHVRDLPLDDARRRLRRAVRRLGEAEVDDFDVPVVGHEDVGRVDVAVHDVERRAVPVGELVRVVQAVGHARADPRDHVVAEAHARARGTPPTRSRAIARRGAPSR